MRDRELALEWRGDRLLLTAHRRDGRSQLRYQSRAPVLLLRIGKGGIRGWLLCGVMLLLRFPFMLLIFDNEKNKNLADLQYP
jgi:hypothetical protein